MSVLLISNEATCQSNFWSDYQSHYQPLLPITTTSHTTSHTTSQYYQSHYQSLLPVTTNRCATSHYYQSLPIGASPCLTAHNSRDCARPEMNTNTNFLWFSADGVLEPSRRPTAETQHASAASTSRPATTFAALHHPMHSSASGEAPDHFQVVTIAHW